jgi:hypothetical protein
MTMELRSSALLAAMLLLAVGCSSTGTSGGSAAGENTDAGPAAEAPESGTSGTSGATGTTGGGTAAQGSGFLGDYSQLKPAPDREGVMLYMDRSRNLSQYTKVMFDPVVVYATPGPDAADIPPDVKQRLGDDLLASFRKQLVPQYQVVTQPGPDVLRVRTAITGIQAVKTDLRARDFLPIMAIYRVATQKHVAEMTAEMEVLDANGKRVAAATATRKGDEKLEQGNKVTWNDLNAISDYWAKNFRQRLDELRSQGTKVGTAN